MQRCCPGPRARSASGGRCVNWPYAPPCAVAAGIARRASARRRVRAYLVARLAGIRGPERPPRRSTARTHHPITHLKTPERPGFAVHVDRFRRALPQCWDPAVDGSRGRRLPSKRIMRQLLRDPRDVADRPPEVRDAGLWHGVRSSASSRGSATLAGSIGLSGTLRRRTSRKSTVWHEPASQKRPGGRSYLAPPAPRSIAPPRRHTPPQSEKRKRKRRRWAQKIRTGQVHTEAQRGASVAVRWNVRDSTACHMLAAIDTGARLGQ